MNIKFLDYQENKSSQQECKRQPAVVMFAKAMVERVAADRKGEHDHTTLKYFVVYDVDAKKRETVQE